MSSKMYVVVFGPSVIEVWLDGTPKGPSSTENATATQGIVNYYVVAFYHAPHIYYAVDPSLTGKVPVKPRKWHPHTQRALRDILMPRGKN